MSNPTDRILSFDPGDTTGIAFLHLGEIVMGINANLEMFQKDDFLPTLVKMTQPDLIVVEIPPRAARFNVIPHAELFQHLTKWFTNAGFRVILLNPGQWKKMVSRSEIKSTHIRDAADMARFAYEGILHDQQR